jgi:hypothetical protein
MIRHLDLDINEILSLSRVTKGLKCIGARSTVISFSKKKVARAVIDKAALAENPEPRGFADCSSITYIKPRPQASG